MSDLGTFASYALLDNSVQTQIIRNTNDIIVTIKYETILLQVLFPVLDAFHAAMKAEIVPEHS